jgi:3-keto steroid reductase
VGFGICQRLLFQLCEKDPQDARPQSFSPDANYDLPPECDGLTLIMACRSTKRAEEARTLLLSLFDSHIDKLRKQPGYDGHAHEFRKNVNIEIHALDLASISSVFRFAEGMSR